ncbi:GntR family transcriptional regulator [Massilia sp. WF1]|uniref:GntR family transcriptional regulator n=1 Tax=unclassified Massilia TaxID=2609279 RepID=UPI00064B5914|nr:MULTISPECIES: GntR family transcriptional regulator [unclassified Massilia]ALK98257.1 GntR family transcriptional regulator [Massilia sp. WG5]KLU37166.1 GntR family transcriptional regulator [Massilia sp. WF1]
MNQVPSNPNSNGAAGNNNAGSAGGASGTGMSPTSTSPTFSPLYQQIKALITQSLQSGEWKPGELIPSEVELAGRYKVSQGTVRKAIDELAAEHLVVRRQGKGTFVASHNEARAHFRFLKLMPDEGVPHPADHHYLEVKRIRAPAEVARLLDLKSGDAVVYIKRTMSFDGAPTILEELWLPGQLFKGLTAERLAEYKGAMYGLFESEFGTRMIRATEKIRAVVADAGAAEYLKVPEGTPLLCADRISFTYGDKAVELRRGLYLTTSHHYQNELS